MWGALRNGVGYWNATLNDTTEITHHARIINIGNLGGVRVPSLQKAFDFSPNKTPSSDGKGVASRPERRKVGAPAARGCAPRRRARRARGAHRPARMRAAAAASARHPEGSAAPVEATSATGAYSWSSLPSDMPPFQPKLVLVGKGAASSTIC